MNTPFSLSRRAVLKLAAAGATAGLLPTPALARTASMIAREIPSSSELLPVIGLGTSQVFNVNPTAEKLKPRTEIVRAMLAQGACLIDTSPMYGNSEAVVGQISDSLNTGKKIFLATKVWTEGKQAGITQMQESMRLLKTERIDLMQVHNLLDLDTQLGTVRDWQDQGRIRYNGITHYRAEAIPKLERIIKSTPLDFLQLNYSLGEREAEQRLLPLAADRGVAILINRPYMRGGLFKAVQDQKLPGWAVDFDAQSWGQFFLKYIISHPAVTCVIPGTANPQHMIDNLGAGFGALPDAAMRRKMAAFIDGL